LAALEYAFAPDHPAAQGHFPGNPIIPGAVLLSEVLLAIEADLGRRLQSCRVRSVKFLRPVRPGDRIYIEYSGRGEPGLRITCSAGGRPVLAGEVWCDTAP
jgi:3-hydroxyacyl-[acyl-carrier-protein] dehydratase